MTSKTSQVRIKTDGIAAKVIIDGTDISDQITGYQLSHYARELPVLTIAHNCFYFRVEGEMKVVHKCPMESDHAD